ncbi:DoxX family membrane protein [Nocardioides cavernae]|uniref:MauE/DoxX family redox-associated membrane protein n=1 Tax=Nocardioides TaxID=1839 RepID=UPI0009E9E41B|nr:MULTISPECIES: MauE/DoxX family redox-associated membrane protein [Nocardioides]MCK9823249.1 DoxX family membrane protein [Nocardioides cavernae]
MKDWFGLVARLVTGGVWIVAGALKLPYPADSVRAVRAYDLLPEAVVPAVGHLLPVVEVVIGLCLVLGVLVRGSAAVSALLFVAFVIGISSAWARGLSIDCGCFGGGGEIPDAAAKYPGEIARDVGLLALSAWLVVRPRSRLALDTVLFRSSTDAGPDADPDPEHDTRIDTGGSLDGAEEELAQDRGGEGRRAGPA